MKDAAVLYELSKLPESTLQFVVSLLPAAESLHAKARQGKLSEIFSEEELKDIVGFINSLRTLATSAMKLTDILSKKARSL